MGSPLTLFWMPGHQQPLRLPLHLESPRDLLGPIRREWLGEWNDATADVGLDPRGNGDVPLDWQEWSLEKLEGLRSAGIPVLVTIEGDWDLCGPLNRKIAIETTEASRYFDEHGVVLLFADFSTQRPDMFRYIQSMGRSGVPLIVYYPPDKPPVVLPSALLGPDDLLDPIRATE